MCPHTHVHTHACPEGLRRLNEPVGHSGIRSCGKWPPPYSERRVPALRAEVGQRALVWPSCQGLPRQPAERGLLLSGSGTWGPLSPGGVRCARRGSLRLAGSAALGLATHTVEFPTDFLFKNHVSAGVRRVLQRWLPVSVSLSSGRSKRVPSEAYLETGGLCLGQQALQHFPGTVPSAFPSPSTSCLPRAWREGVWALKCSGN